VRPRQPSQHRVCSTHRNRSRQRRVACVQSAVTEQPPARSCRNSNSCDFFCLLLFFVARWSLRRFLAQNNSTIPPPAAAESGKDVVHALNNAFAKVFEEPPSRQRRHHQVSKGGGGASKLEAILFSRAADDNSPRRGRRSNIQPIQTRRLRIHCAADGCVFAVFRLVGGACRR